MTTEMASTKRSWWKRLSKKHLDSEASHFLQQHGDRACEVARQAARIARNKGEHKQARHYSHLALRISELSGQISLHVERPLGRKMPSTMLGRADEVIE
jgi:hypothetical protein